LYGHCAELPGGIIKLPLSQVGQSPLLLEEEEERVPLEEELLEEDGEVGIQLPVPTLQPAGVDEQPGAPLKQHLVSPGGQINMCPEQQVTGTLNPELLQTGGVPQPLEDDEEELLEEDEELEEVCVQYATPSMTSNCPVVGLNP